MTTVFFVLATLATFYFLAHFPAAMYIKHKNPIATISIKWPVFAAPLILWLATAISYFLA
ncbi:MAG: hypothetical protein A2934_03465 [Candidatus Sungbacteria bacterium RIFCSPLOWO2_01_FULL_47_10]|uniref:Uncharacterized protein n=1 Tax=Candidatus Sungbacteria bacterium RIFCSPLOWO2_01_FULL_47_10 TaxID=1802276 RepID=A0A1G2L4B1_9BACT|nr:MAG: hypothetical protein A2934_03465 [Candidatus Sungbacteria bacterium RIFCSPLOWO2_01_FULL_47_10]